MLFVASPAWLQLASAQAPPSPAPVDGADQLRARYQIGVMERVFEEAVQLGAQVLSHKMQAVAPELPVFSGPARAHGFRLEGYGVFFSVEVPPLRQSLAWTFRQLNLPAVTTAIESLRRLVDSVSDRGARTSFEQALKRIELQVGPLPVSPAMMSQLTGGGPGGGPQVVSQQGEVRDTSALTEVGDPNEAYTSEVKRALIDAMLDHSGSVTIGPDEWLTVAARDNEPRVAPGEMYDVFTILLRIRGSDLAAFRADRMTRDEARRKVEVREF